MNLFFFIFTNQIYSIIRLVLEWFWIGLGSVLDPRLF